MTSTETAAARRAATAIRYDLLRIQASAGHPALSDFGIGELAPPDAGDLDTQAAEEQFELQLEALAEELMPAFEDHLDLEASDPDLAGTRYLQDAEQLVLDEIASVVHAKARLEVRLRLLVAYAREFTPDPPRQVDVAAAAGVSRVQTTRMYGVPEVGALERLLQLSSPRSVREALRNRGEVPDHP